MRIEIIINDETIKQDVLHELDEMEFAEEAMFPSEEAKNELAEEITDTIITRCENDADYLPTWTAVWEAVHDAVREHEYETEEE